MYVALVVELTKVGVILHIYYVKRGGEIVLTNIAVTIIDVHFAYI